MFIRSTGEPVLAQVVGHSEPGDAYRRITYDRDGKTVLHDRASVRRLSLPRAPSPPRVYGGGAVPQGGWGTVFPGVGNDKGGGVMGMRRFRGQPHCVPDTPCTGYCLEWCKLTNMFTWSDHHVKSCTDFDFSEDSARQLQTSNKKAG